MSFLKVFNSCCPFLIAPAMDAEDDLPEHSKDFDETYTFKLHDFAEEDNKRYQQQRLDKYARSKLQIVHHNVLNCMSDYSKDIITSNNNNNILNDADLMRENVSNMVVNDILNKIVY